MVQPQIHVVAHRKATLDSMRNLRLQSKNKKLTTENGFVAFTTILVVSIVTLGVAVSISLLGVGEARNSLDFKRGHETLKIAEACVEEGLLRLRNEDTYTGTGATPLPVGNGSCTISVSGVGSDRTIDVVGNHNATPTFSKGIQVTVKRTGNSINIVSWQEQ